MGDEKNEESLSVGLHFPNGPQEKIFLYCSIEIEAGVGLIIACINLESVISIDFYRGLNISTTNRSQERQHPTSKKELWAA